MVRPTNLIASGFVDLFRAVRKKLSNNHIFVGGSREVGKSTLITAIETNSEYSRKPDKTETAQPTQTYTIDYLGDQYDRFKVRIQDVAGERVHWSDTVRRIVNNRPPVIIFMLRAFELRDDGLEIKKMEHLMQVPGLIDSFRIMKLDDGMGKKKDVWYCGEDMEAFEFLRTLLFDHPNLYTNYPDVMSRCVDVHNKLFRRKGKIAPTHLYMVVNFADTLQDSDIEGRAKEILKPYESLLMRWTDKGVKVKRKAISARYGHNIEQLLKDIGEDKRWT